MTIYLFGDSFVDNEPAEFLNVRNHKRWYEFLKENCNEEVMNYGKCGTGQIYTMNKFLDFYENFKFKPNDKFVIVLSSPYRIPWKWSKKIGDDAAIYKSFFNEDENFKGINFTENQKYALKFFYETMHDDLARSTVKNIFLLKNISSNNNWKMMVFTVYPINMNPYQKKYNEHVYNLKNINNELFHLYDTPLYVHSCNEWLKLSEIDEGMINHFSEKNHVIISNIITNHFLKTKYYDKFYEKIIKKTISKPKQIKEFIYI